MLDNTIQMVMCDPKYFQIQYEINPYMDTNSVVDQELAQEQWENLKRTLEKMKVSVHVVDSQPGFPDMTFAGDCGLALNNKFIPSKFMHEERRGEEIFFRDYLKSLDYTVSEIPGEYYFEGEGDVIKYQHTMVFASGGRSSQESFDFVRSCMPESDVKCCLQIVSDNFYHCGLALSIIDSNSVVYYPPAFTPESCQKIEGAFDRTYKVSEIDAMENFACNCIVVGDSVIVGACSSEFEKQLNNWGKQVIKCPVSEFNKSGASVRCLVATI